MSDAIKLGALVGSEADLPQSRAEIDISGLTADSREVLPGFLFAALPGTQVDGMRFVPDALAKGAAALLVAKGREGDLDASIPVISDPLPRRRLAQMAARFFADQPRQCVAITGTNGKTSVAAFVRQIWQSLGYDAASLGTVGVVTKKGAAPLSHTTPDPVTLHKILGELAAQGISHLALEASSHGLAQNRLDGVNFIAGAFTNISRDHLDYHADFEDYFSQKLRLFSELLTPGSPAVIDMDSYGGSRVAEVSRKHALEVFTVGRTGESLTLVDVKRDGFAQILTIIFDGEEYKVRLPLVGDFQAANALVAAGLCIATGYKADDVMPCLEALKGAEGRLEHVGTSPKGAPIFIDYAHTPNALENALVALRPYAKRRLIVVFGCGGDRDKGKRPQMGAIAIKSADLVYVTDDNPRGEDPRLIRADIMSEAAGAIEIGDRQNAISTAVSDVKSGDLLLIAGKGHETGQIIGQDTIPFSDHEAVENALKGVRKNFDS